MSFEGVTASLSLGGRRGIWLCHGMTGFEIAAFICASAMVLTMIFGGWS